ncbi:DUF5063 domain-containing protein [Nocardioides sp.]|uniref:DUF5063 domain-containing protein n=1 Tax=Nocardioides sp. TaxID=35761 RepID=UPI00261CDE97|nr:DUF5063 domain-containing protein [Nocardioides sp.]
MTEQLPGQAALAALVAAESENVAFATEIAASVESYLDAVRLIAEEAQGGQAVSLLLLQISQISLTGARLGAVTDFEPREEFQPDVGPEVDVDEVRMRLADLLGDLDTYSFVFDPYAPEIVESQLSDDITSIGADLENGLRHYRNGDVAEALWWWQYSYVNNWGNLAGAALNALLMVVAHDRLDVDVIDEHEQLEAAAALDA